MIVGQPAIGRSAAVLPNGFVLPLPPEPVRLRGCIVWRDSRGKLLLEVKRPSRQPTLDWHVDGIESLSHLRQPCIVGIRVDTHTPILI